MHKSHISILNREERSGGGGIGVAVGVVVDAAVVGVEAAWLRGCVTD